MSQKYYLKKNNSVPLVIGDRKFEFESTHVVGSLTFGVLTTDDQVAQDLLATTTEAKEISKADYDLYQKKKLQRDSLNKPIHSVAPSTHQQLQIHRDGQGNTISHLPTQEEVAAVEDDTPDEIEKAEEGQPLDLDTAKETGTIHAEVGTGTTEVRAIKELRTELKKTLGINDYKFQKLNKLAGKPGKTDRGTYVIADWVDFARSSKIV